MKESFKAAGVHMMEPEDFITKCNLISRRIKKKKADEKSTEAGY